jgi:hypothetical protein
MSSRYVYTHDSYYPFPSPLQTKIQVRTEQRYHGLLCTVRTIWKVSSLLSPLHHFSIENTLATRHRRLLRRSLPPTITQSPQLRHRLGGVRRCPYVHMDLNLSSSLHRYITLHSRILFLDELGNSLQLDIRCPFIYCALYHKKSTSTQTR